MTEKTALAEFVARLDYKKMTKAQIANEKRWFTTQQNMERRHDAKMAALNWFSADPTAKYFAGAAAGAGVALAGTLIQEITEDMDMPPPPPKAPSLAWLWLFSGGPGGIAGLAAAGLTEKSFDQDMGGSITGIMKIGGTGFAGMCVALLFLHAIFGGEGGILGNIL